MTPKECRSAERCRFVFKLDDGGAGGPDIMKIEQLHKGAYLLPGEVGGRPLLLPLLVEDDQALLIDTGCVQHVEELILPGLRELGLPSSSLHMVVTTHCDFDHVGGNRRIKELAPQALLCCGDADRDRVESPDVLYKTRYDIYRPDGIFYPDDTRAWIMGCMDRPQAIDLTLRGGERIRLGRDREFEVLHLPGHSRGHLGLFDRRRRALFGGDAIHGAAYLDLAGKPALCPTYLYPAEYLQTIAFIEGLDLSLYSGCHWPVKRDGEVGAFCEESRAFVWRAEELVLDALVEPRSLRRLCHDVGPRLGNWPFEVNNDLCYAFSGHLEDLTGRGLIQKLPGDGPSHYQQQK